MATIAISRLDSFQPDSVQTSAYLERMQLFFQANEVVNKNQVQEFLSAIGGSDLLFPEKPATKTFAHAVEGRLNRAF